MKFKTNLVIGAIFLALLSFVYFYEIKGGEARKKAAKKAKELLSFNKSEAQRLSVVRKDTTIVLEKKEEGWKLVSPVEDEADQAAVDRYLRNLKEAERERVIVDSSEVASDPGKATRYGLDEPRLKICLETEDGVLDTLWFGKDSPTERYTYVQQRGANPEIFVVRAWRFDNLDKSVFDLRDRRVLAFEKGEVQEIRMAHPEGEEMVVKRTESGGWRFQEPVEAYADSMEMEHWLNRLKNGRVRAFADEDPDEEALAGYGLAPVRTLEISLFVGKDRAEKRLRIGKEADKGRYYARDMSAPQVFLIDSTLVHQLQKSVDELRDKKPVRFVRDRVSRIELHNSAGEEIVAEKDTAGVWSIVSPESRKARSWKLDGLLTDLKDLEAKEFVRSDDEGYRTAKKKQLLTCRLSDGKETLLEARFVGRADGEIYMVLEGDPSVYRIDAGDFGDLDLTLKDLAQPLPKKAEAAEPDTGSTEAGSDSTDG